MVVIIDEIAVCFVSIHSEFFGCMRVRASTIWMCRWNGVENANFTHDFICQALVRYERSLIGHKMLE